MTSSPDSITILNDPSQTGQQEPTGNGLRQRSGLIVMDGASLTRYQECPRRWKIEQDWKTRKWYPKRLFDACLRQGILSLSNGHNLPAVRSATRSRFLEVAGNPGLEVVGDSYQIAMDWCGMLDTTLSAITRTTLLSLRQLDPIPLQESVNSWQPLSLADDSGTLHRWITVDSWNENELWRNLHSWTVVGDSVLCDAPLTLHVVVIGQQREGRRTSPWAKVWKHMVGGRLKFRHEGEGWKPLWYADQQNPDPDAWVDMMEKEGLLQALLIDQPFLQVSDTSVKGVRRELALLGESLLQLLPTPAESIPMSRGACDGFHPCPWQALCYRSEGEWDYKAIAGLGLYLPVAGVSLGHQLTSR